MVKITIRIQEESLHKALVETAKQNRRSMNAEILRAIEYYLKNAPEAHYQVGPVKKIRKKEAKP